MKQRLSVITLGVNSLEESKRFYCALGWIKRGIHHLRCLNSESEVDNIINSAHAAGGKIAVAGYQVSL